MQKLIIFSIIVLILLIGCTQPTTEDNSVEYDADYEEMVFPPDATGEDIPQLPTEEGDDNSPLPLDDEEDIPQLPTEEGENLLPPGLPPMDE